MYPSYNLKGYPGARDFEPYQYTTGGITSFLIRGTITREMAEEITGTKIEVIVAIDIANCGDRAAAVRALTEWRDKEKIPVVNLADLENEELKKSESQTAGNPALQATFQTQRLSNVQQFASLLDEVTATPGGWKIGEASYDNYNPSPKMVVKDKGQLLAVIQKLEAAGLITPDMEQSRDGHLRIELKNPPSRLEAGKVVPFQISALEHGPITLEFNHSVAKSYPERMKPFVDAALRDNRTSFQAMTQNQSQSSLTIWAESILAKGKHKECMELLGEIMPANVTQQWGVKMRGTRSGTEEVDSFVMQIPNGRDRQVAEVLEALDRAKIMNIGDGRPRDGKTSYFEPSKTPQQAGSYVSLSYNNEGAEIKINADFLQRVQLENFTGLAAYAAQTRQIRR